MITTPEGIPGVPPPLYLKNRVSKQPQGNLPALTVWYPMLLLISKRSSKRDSMKLHMLLAEISLLIIILRVWSHFLSHLTLSKWAHANRSKLYLRIERVENMSRPIVVCLVRVPKRHSIIPINHLPEWTQVMADLTLQITKNHSSHLPWNQETLMEKALAWLDPLKN